MADERSEALKLMEETLRSIAESADGTVTGAERMRASLALLVLVAAQTQKSEGGEKVSANEFRLIVHLVIGSGGLPQEKDWWEKLLSGLGDIAKVLT
ncbi:MAG: hypothetical protein OXK82_02685 [Deltaproteobacteria bacterium]|nr:hypothetical protein [Deltaproteobacteria bacterium]